MSKQTRGIRYATITNLNGTGFDSALVDELLNSTSAQAHFISQSVNLASRDAFTGLDLDFELVPSWDAVRFLQFVGNLYAALRQHNIRLSIDVPARTGDGSDWWSNAYDYPTLGARSDLLNLKVLAKHHDGGCRERDRRSSCVRALGQYEPSTLFHLRVG